MGETLASRTDYAPTGGVFSREQGESDAFRERIGAGVVYLNRRAGATTGAGPGVQPFGAGKGARSSGKSSGGLYYGKQFLRLQGRTLVR